MKIIKKDKVMIDVDSTLVRWPLRYHEPNSDLIEANYYGTTVYLDKHYHHIDLLKAYKARGFHVTVHSANGWKWALEIVQKLQLESFVDEVSTKFSKYIDDKHVDDWSKQIFINPDDKDDING
jgi:hypothetical protein